ncbi:hypothetical protein BS47DRAFT_1367411 [Hydnum rufescens UP504]|uniref:Uncharacterized protein n=1 Tax=Hydnum rufescens UP504 TaxID=1448309 RepID=A0A9P6AJE5_9AGAM|nr:hypothetical protein BS47DRAFT_1367411 [Hydnum rufescens UP504]
MNVNVTVDDFESVILFSDESQWFTSDPSKNLPFDPAKSPWLVAREYASKFGERTMLNAPSPGPALFVYGASGPDYGSYEVSIDGESIVLSAHASFNASSPHLLYSNSSLSYANHTLKLTNLGAQSTDQGASKFLFDYLLATTQLAPSGATVTNTTIQETNPRLNFVGNWTTNTPNPAFSGGGSKYTREDGASVSLTFNGSAVYIFGDKVNDHGLFNVTLDSRPPQTFNGVAGCGGTFAKACEKTNTLAFFAGSLGPEEHTITVQNIAGINHSFFDLDDFVVTTPSQYFIPSPITSSSVASGTRVQASSTTSRNGDMGTAAPLPFINTMILVLLGFMWFL